MKKSLLFFLLQLFLYSSEITPLSKSNFLLNGNEIDMFGINYIVIELTAHNNGAGNFYAIDKDGDLWLSGPITAGAYGHRTPSGYFPIIYKKRYHMSSKYPDPYGRNNMDYMMMFTSSGMALHKGNIKSMSHGCIHIDRKDVSSLFRWVNSKTKIIITRNIFRKYILQDIVNSGLNLKARYWLFRFLAII